MNVAEGKSSRFGISMVDWITERLGESGLNKSVFLFGILIVRLGG